ncbi:Thiamine biosynthesis lipoprotein ApbE precursor [Novipirellula galeiformis]|uniref:FAD:protein FMN transferase n=2 Tax=Novipirellula galeiformis TaxID=2528004 RepID=A0A5C6CGT9_9BACT|nr:Thiamine biosynthesis lipoprotein ApbE precursor [Novipirellula galeiformis]
MIPFAAFSFAAALLWLAGSPAVAQDGAEIREFRGQTMGTTYMVKVYDPPKLADGIDIEIDAELRSVNDQMSTYLKSSEISRFNASESTDWFDVSAETALVVDAALRISKATNGAFDVTVGPLVNAWSFGPDAKTNTVPSDETIATLRESVGYEKLAVRIEPPALKKSTSSLKVDLSSIAKGHGVDRVIALLERHGAKNVFVEIGGEVRVTGKKGDQPWKVGIQDPRIEQSGTNETPLAAAHPIENQAMATSGDYRIFFEVDGKRYSHTLDPRSGRPIDHDLASVSVIAPTCMEADGWATAINVLGAEQGAKIAAAEGLDILLIRHRGNEFTRLGTGTLAQYATDPKLEPHAAQTQTHQAAQPGDAAHASEEATFFAKMLPTLIITLIGFGIILSAMAIGVIFGRKSISGSCGGLAGKKNDDGSVSCSLCSNPSDACQELREQMKKDA